MSKTYRLTGYKNGKPIYSKHQRKDSVYRYYSHEYVETRKQLWRSYRRQCKKHIKRGWEIPKWSNTRGWMTW